MIIPNIGNTAHKQVIAKYMSQLEQWDEVKSVSVNYKGQEYRYDRVPLDTLHNIRSLSKFITSLCVGVLIQNQKCFNMHIDLSTRIWPIFRRFVKSTVNEEEKLNKIRLEHLLCQTTGFDDGHLLFRNTIDFTRIDELLERVFNTPVVYEPGEKFVYSNASYYLLSCFLQEVTGMRLDEFFKKYIMDKLSTEAFLWQPYGKYCPGATGLNISFSAFQSIVRAFVGTYATRESPVLPYDFVRKIVEYKHPVSEYYTAQNALQPMAYGFGAFKSKAGCIYVNGAGGQLLLYDGQKDLTISVFSDFKRTEKFYWVTMRLLSVL